MDYFKNFIVKLFAINEATTIKFVIIVIFIEEEFNLMTFLNLVNLIQKVYFLEKVRLSEFFLCIIK